MEDIYSKEPISRSAFSPINITLHNIHWWGWSKFLERSAHINVCWQLYFLYKKRLRHFSIITFILSRQVGDWCGGGLFFPGEKLEQTLLTLKLIDYSHLEIAQTQFNCNSANVWKEQRTHLFKYRKVLVMKNVYPRAKKR